MPIYTFSCKNCSAKFDILVGVGIDRKSPSCPVCGSNNLKKLFSTFRIGKSAKLNTQTTSGKSCSNCSFRDCSNCY